MGALIDFLPLIEVFNVFPDLPDPPACSLYHCRDSYINMFSTRFFSAFGALVVVVNALPAPQAAEYPIPASQPPPGPAPPTNPEAARPVLHGPYSGKPTIIGAPSLSVLAASIPALPPNPTATTYIADGKLHDPQPAPYVPAGGLGTNGEEPVYNVKSDFDFHSLVRPSSFLLNFG